MSGTYLALFIIAFWLLLLPSVRGSQLRTDLMLNECPNNCSGIGTCDEARGECFCPFEYLWSDDCSQPRKDFIDWEQFDRYVYCVLAIYGGLELSVVVILVFVNWGCPPRGLTTQTACYVCLMLALASRIVYYAIDPGAFYFTLPAWLDRFLHFVMFLLLFSSFTAILYNWAASNWRASMARKDVLEKLKLSFILINTLVYLIDAIFTILTIVLDNGQGFLRLKSVVLNLIFMCAKILVMGFAFIYFGIKIYVQLKKFTPLSYDGLRALRMVKMLTLVTSIVFALALVYIWIYVARIRYDSGMFLVSDAIINTFSWMAAILVMILLGKPRRPRRKERVPTEKTFGTFPETGGVRRSQGSDSSTPILSDDDP